jgi:hypothetical protein
MSRLVGASETPPLHRAYDPDDVVDFHAARLLILLLICGQGRMPAIEGRTKLAKLDFFIRYPSFLERAERHLADQGSPSSEYRATGAEVEAPMIRYRYGPWDPRYRQFLAFLEARSLVRVAKRPPEKVTLSAAGRGLAEVLAGEPAFAPLTARCRAMVGNLADMTGTRIKEFVYDIFAEEIAALTLRQVIEP